ncbi:MAG: TetR/AcrR family transcriptional regulator [Clostridiales bacterium]|nr:TetR/AcrR family transcriptional regulator [Clostridiales bacterium]
MYENTPPRHKPTFDNIPEEKRRRVLDTATEEFANEGFGNANIERIAKRAGISVGSIYKYFDSKRDLFLTVVYGGLDTLSELLEGLYASDEDILLKAETIIRTIIEVSRTEPSLIKLYARLASENSDEEFVRHIASIMESVSAKVYASAISEAQKTGEIRTDIDPRMLSFMLDNLFVLLQYSYSCEYYKERFRIFAGDNAAENDDFVVEQMLMFIKSAFLGQKS